jgi:hypothetical protein
MNPPIETVYENGVGQFRDIAENYLAESEKNPFGQDVPIIESLAGGIHFDIKSKNFIAVPVHAHDRMLYAFLNSFKTGPEAEQFNICIFLNSTQDQCSASDFENARLFNSEIVQKWNSRKGFKSATVISSYLPNPASMGRVRKILTDAIITYCLMENIADPIIVCNDVDQLLASPTYLTDIADSFKSNDNPVFIAAPVGYGYIGDTPVGLPDNIHVPELYLFNRIQNSINYCIRTGLTGLESAIWPEGANLAFSGTAYCCAGGFDPRRASGEDDAMGISLYSLVKDGHYGRGLPVQWGKPVFVDSAWIATDPRRVLSAIHAGRTGIEAWSWQDFNETLGSTLDTCSLAAHCAIAAGLLQKCHFESLSSAVKDDTWEFVTSRIGWVFFRSVVLDRRTRNLAQLQSVASVFGLTVTGGILDYENTQFEAATDWDGSPVLDELIQIFGKNLNAPA